MGFFDKLAFWKKKDELDDLGKDFGLGKDLGLDIGAGPSPDLGMGLEPSQTQQPMQKYPSFQTQQTQSGFQMQPSFLPAQPTQQPSFSGDSGYINSKNLEVISSKLDALRAALESINQRLANIEAIARGEQEDTRRRRYY
ncbi:hypothetical protein HYY70_03930 [Candidatus Woesearchaeota archaeon]|nr:hypothetical protein [Candidatus Woesearchaeota archaeon]